MTFSEKLVFLMNMTMTTNKQLADAANVDPSLISLMRTGRREPPGNSVYLKKISVYFSRKCDGNYQRAALSEVMGRKHLQLQMDAKQLSSVIFDWLTDDRDRVEKFLNTFERFSVKKSELTGRNNESTAQVKNDPVTFAYYGDDGKRGAVNDFISHLLTSNVTGTILLSIDESFNWLFDEPSYLTRLQEQVMLLLQKGFRICRIAMPLNKLDQAFDSLSLWLPLYMTGQVDSFYYPRLRDDLYRRTFIVLPDVGAVVSASTGGQLASRATMFTLDPRLTNAFAGDFRDALSKCRPMMTTYSGVMNAKEILSCISRFESDRGNRIQQSTTLSSITSPPELIRLALEGRPEYEEAMIAGSMSKAQSMFCQSLTDYEVIDIHSLASADQVCAGTVPVAVSYLCKNRPMYYTPETYILHLQSILDHMERYENYRAVVLPESGSTHALMVKEGRQTLLLRPSIPLMVFEVSQPNIAEACHEYLMRTIEMQAPPAMQRHDTRQKLEQMIQELKHR